MNRIKKSELRMHQSQQAYEYTMVVGEKLYTLLRTFMPNAYPESWDDLPNSVKESYGRIAVDYIYFVQEAVDENVLRVLQNVLIPLHLDI
jgi:hypothetical protein